ncbi:hypothetical protein A6X21_06160 [Planctopirus hydrillae]|uniref:Uncharacterized protein n=1 Tax=Planctopirus hydrillae TaxID=1841610 RepID=A0A1C3EAC4_9PLAN|nr:hypothetical protein A6X21_06160 [Planctopirus hydrillae]
MPGKPKRTRRRFASERHDKRLRTGNRVVAETPVNRLPGGQDTSGQFDSCTEQGRSASLVTSRPSLEFETKDRVGFDFQRSTFERLVETPAGVPAQFLKRRKADRDFL